MPTDPNRWPARMLRCARAAPARGRQRLLRLARRRSSPAPAVTRAARWLVARSDKDFRYMATSDLLAGTPRLPPSHAAHPALWSTTPGAPLPGQARGSGRSGVAPRASSLTQPLPRPVPPRAELSKEAFKPDTDGERRICKSLLKVCSRKRSRSRVRVRPRKERAHGRARARGSLFCERACARMTARSLRRVLCPAHQ